MHDLCMKSAGCGSGQCNMFPCCDPDLPPPVYRRPVPARRGILLPSAEDRAKIPGDSVVQRGSGTMKSSSCGQIHGHVWGVLDLIVKLYRQVEVSLIALWRSVSPKLGWRQTAHGLVCTVKSERSSRSMIFFRVFLLLIHPEACVWRLLKETCWLVDLSSMATTMEPVIISLLYSLGIVVTVFVASTNAALSQSHWFPSETWPNKVPPVESLVRDDASAIASHSDVQIGHELLNHNHQNDNNAYNHHYHVPSRFFGQEAHSQRAPDFYHHQVPEGPATLAPYKAPLPNDSSPRYLFIPTPNQSNHLTQQATASPVWEHDEIKPMRVESVVSGLWLEGSDPIDQLHPSGKPAGAIFPPTLESNLQGPPKRQKAEDEESSIPKTRKKIDVNSFRRLPPEVISNAIRKTQFSVNILFSPSNLTYQSISSYKNQLANLPAFSSRDYNIKIILFLSYVLIYNRFSLPHCVYLLLFLFLNQISPCFIITQLFFPFHILCSIIGVILCASEYKRGGILYLINNFNQDLSGVEEAITSFCCDVKGTPDLIPALLPYFQCMYFGFPFNCESSPLLLSYFASKHSQIKCKSFISFFLPRLLLRIFSSVDQGRLARGQKRLWRTDEKMNNQNKQAKSDFKTGTPTLGQVVNLRQDSLKSIKELDKQGDMIRVRKSLQD
ncbi:hypothetical protein VP01_1335g3 [Puccinia sorghi]|uniref:Uncharacterized protein n=1 Tax=Puccinia sorghi TaxID=27349 RepID=A0A0L6VMD3_9BASI|nr:hypothetical protein VP01_1335g3 [Puccinia sorghi]